MVWETRSQPTVISTVIVYYCWRCSQEKDPQITCSKITWTFMILLKEFCPNEWLTLWTLHLEKEDTETRTNVTHSQNRIGCPKILECLILIFEIGVSCSMEFPRESMNISDVLAQLNLIREKLLRTKICKERVQLNGKFFMTQYLF